MKSIEKILKNYDNLVIMHPHFQEVTNRILTHIHHGAPGRVLFVVGPTGVGKTMAKDWTFQATNGFVKDNKELGYGNPISVEVPAPETGDFTWKPLYLCMLNALGEPGLAAKFNMDRAIEALSRGEKPSTGTRLTNAELRNLTSFALRRDRTVAVFIDEAQHFSIVNSTVRKRDHLDVVKSLANDKSTIFVLFGTYEARQMLYQGAQLSRRVEIVHFQRYRKEILEEYEAFSDTLETLFRQIEIPLDPKLSENIGYFYDHCLGCVGILMTWFRRALERRVANGKRGRLTKAEIDTARLSNMQLQIIAEEIAWFETEHQEEGDFNFDAIFDIQLPDIFQNTHKITPRRRPGKRNPKRDPVGVY